MRLMRDMSAKERSALMARYSEASRAAPSANEGYCAKYFVERNEYAGEGV